MASTKRLDERPFEAFDKTDEKVKPIRCWYKDTAQEVARQHGKNWAVRQRSKEDLKKPLVTAKPVEPEPVKKKLKKRPPPKR